VQLKKRMAVEMQTETEIEIEAGTSFVNNLDEETMELKDFKFWTSLL
jgi:hypothetical protein